MNITVAIFVVIFLAVTSWILKAVLSHRRISRHVNKFPGPPGLPFPVGHALMMAPNHAGWFQQIRELCEEFRLSPPMGIFKLWLGPFPFIIISKGKAAEVILSSYKFIEKGREYDFLHRWLGTGLLTSTGEKWRTRRKFLTPAFHFQILTEFVEIFYEQSVVLVERLAEKVKTRDEFDISQLITRCTLDVICETAMGKKIHAQTNDDSTYVQAVYRASDLIFDQMIKPWWHSDLVYNLFGRGKELTSTLKTLHDFTDSVIRERQSTMTASGRPTGRRMAFLDLLLSAKTEDGTPLDHASIREEVDTFMFEGHDTTAAAANFAVFLLGSHSEVQKRAQDEIDTVFGKSDRAPTTDDLKNLTYLEKVIKETLRLYPSVPYIQRKAPEDFTLGSHTVPKGSNLVIVIFSMQRDPDVFQNPDKFDPERFGDGNDEGLQTQTPFDYVPFSAGPRNCIGQKFALMEEKTILSTILRRFTIESMEKPDELQIQGELITRPVNGVRVKLIPRQTFSKDSQKMRGTDTANVNMMT